MDPTDRAIEEKRHFVKPIQANDLVDRNAVSCTRCAIQREIAGDELDLLERRLQRGRGCSRPNLRLSVFGNTIELCPVGALTSVKFRFRPDRELTKLPSICTVQRGLQHQSGIPKWEY